MVKKRCPWAESSEIEKIYHDEEWGKPCHDEDKLFEFLILEGQQAGLSWRTILNKREAMRIAFDQFDYHKIAQYDEVKLAELMENAAIIRNRRKMVALVANANAFLAVQKQYGSFEKFIWSYVANEPIINRWEKVADVPASTELSKQISKDMKKLGFNFVGETIMYAFMQATGMVDDHLVGCFCHS